MGKIAKIISVEVKETQIICTCQAKYNHNVSAVLYLPPGDDSYPIAEKDYTILVEIEGTGNYIAAGILTKNIGSTSGEKLLYSRNSSGIEQAKLLLKKDGKFVFNDGTDFAVRYNELKTQLDQLRTDLNNFVTVFNSHTQTLGGTPTIAQAPASPATPSSVDFTNCKVDNINLEGVGE